MSKKEVGKKSYAPENNVNDPRWRILGRGLRRSITFTLDLLRKSVGISQYEIARRSKMTQSEVSRLERRNDWRLSTLSRYAEALGGRLVISVEMGGHRYEVGQAKP
jgi:predicted transcriptional regulator